VDGTSAVREVKGANATECADVCDAIATDHAPHHANEKMYEFDKASHGHFEYRILETTKDSVTVDVYEANDLFEALGCGVRRQRTTFTLRDGKVKEMNVTSILDARKPFAEVRKAFIAWAEKERPAEAAKFIEKGRLRMTGSAAAPMLALAKEWAKQTN